MEILIILASILIYVILEGLFTVLRDHVSEKRIEKNERKKLTSLTRKRVKIESEINAKKEINRFNLIKDFIH